MAVKGFASTAAALARVVDCILPICDPAEDGTEPIVHTGSGGSGETIDCCAGPCVLRVEDTNTFPAGGEVTLSQKCIQLTVDVDVIYSQCFRSNTKGGKARPPADLTADGLELTISGYEALERLKCCTPWNQWIRFVSLTENPPMGNCAGWTLRLNVDVRFCGPCTPGS